MKRFYLLFTTLITIVIGISELSAQSMEKDQFSSPQAARKAARAAHKAAAAVQAQQSFAQAVNALKNGSFVVEVDQIVFPRGMTKYVNTTTNFVSMRNGKGVVQIATSNFYPGQNGLGGITVEGTVRNMKLNQDKKGTVYYNYSVQGIAISASVNIQLGQDGNRATVTIYPNFTGNNLTLNGDLVPYSASRIFQGSTL